MKRDLNRLYLLVVALILFGLLLVPAILFVLVRAIAKGSARKALGYFSAFCFATALGIDVMGNVLARDLLNGLFCGPGGYSFGAHGETISSALGKNKLRGTLTGAGRTLAAILDFLDPDHVERAASRGIIDEHLYD